MFSRELLFIQIAVCCLLCIQTSLLAWVSWSDAPLVDEPAHLVSGLSHWEFGRFDLYRVNPPLVRTVAAFPVQFFHHENAWASYSVSPYNRAEFLIGHDFLCKNSERYRLFLFLGRIACLPFALLGTVICYHWASGLYGIRSGFIAASLWVFSPYVLGFGGSIIPDVASASMSLIVFYYFWNWTKTPTWKKTIHYGFLLGFAELTKFTLIIFYPVWIFLALTVWFFQSKSNTFQYFIRIFFAFCISISVIHLCYFCEGSFKPLKDFNFVSKMLCGNTKWNHETGFAPLGNRFRESFIGNVLVPMPKNYILGIDLQKFDFERGLPSYLRGEWSDHGWWYFYLYALLIKTPLGTLGLLTLALSCTFFIRDVNVSWRDEMIVLLPGLVILVFVSSQTGFSIHSRYVIPALPFFFIWMSKVGKVVTLKHPVLATLAILLLSWSIISSLSVYPHTISYFNELVGGPKNGGKHLLDSNIDWGQDLFYLEKWCKNHPDVKEIWVAYQGSFPIEHTTIPDGGVPSANAPQPGWYALSVNYLYDREKRYRYFLNFEPIAKAGYSIYIYHLTQDDVDRIQPH